MSATALEAVKNYVEKGLDDIMSNKDDFITNLSIAANLKGPKKSKANNGPVKGTLKALGKLLEKDGHRIERDENTWPLYHLYLKDGEIKHIVFKGKVEEFHDIFVNQGIDGLLVYEKK